MLVKQAIAGWLLRHDVVWPLDPSAPWWLLTHYSARNEVQNLLDGALILATMLARCRPPARLPLPSYRCHGPEPRCLVLAARSSPGTGAQPARRRRRFPRSPCRHGVDAWGGGLRSALERCRALPPAGRRLAVVAGPRHPAPRAATEEASPLSSLVMARGLHARRRPVAGAAGVGRERGGSADSAERNGAATPPHPHGHHRQIALRQATARQRQHHRVLQC